MRRGVLWWLSGSGLLGVLAGLADCSGFHGFAEREPWRHEAELQCLGSGAVREGPGKVRISAIQGPGVCGADFPLKVLSLGTNTFLGYDEDLRPPGLVPELMQPHWPAAPPPYPLRQEVRPELPMSLDPAGRNSQATSDDPRYVRRPSYGAVPGRAPVTSGPIDANSPAYDYSPVPYERRPPLGPSRGTVAPLSIGPISVSPAATLACPLASALDQWIDTAVQPSALRWFGQPVVEIKQISAYSCRGMNGDPNAHISEHAFGNALDIATFMLADGRKVNVKEGWHGSPEMQGFLHDVQGAACERFTTVLAPGSNAFHSDHIHVDLMRRNSGRHACEPSPVPGAEVAARLRGRFSSQQSIETVVTGSIVPRRTVSPLRHGQVRPDDDDRPALPIAKPGEDGQDADQ
jgi:hypothetical protein